MNCLSRSTALKIAAALSFLLSMISLIGSLPLITQGAAFVNQSADSPPYFVMLLAFVAGVVGVVAAYGAWKSQSWGIILTILVNLVNGIAAAPGLLFAPMPALFAAALVTVVFIVIIIVLCLWRDRNLVAA